MDSKKFDSSCLVGLAFGFFILVAALVLGQVPLGTLLSPEALLIVFGGTTTATLVSFNFKTLNNAIGALVECFYHSPHSPRHCLNYVLDVVSFIREEGILALQPMLPSVEIPFLKKGLELVVDNRQESFIRDSLSTEIEVAYREQMDYARVFETAGGFAPTMGIIGAIIGLIYVVNSFHDPAHLGQGVASAFSATLYGVAISNLFLLPIAGKLKQRAREDWFIKTLLLEAIISIRTGDHPIIMEQKLNAFLGGNTITSTAGLSVGNLPAHAGPVPDEILDNILSEV